MRLTFWSRLFSRDCAFSCSRRSCAWSADSSALFLDRTSAISSFALKRKDVRPPQGSRITVMRPIICYLLCNFFLRMGLQGLVALLLLFNPGQIVLGTSFQRFFVLFVTLNDFLVFLKSLKKIRERPLHRIQITGHLLLLRQGLIELLLGLLLLFLLISCIQITFYLQHTPF